MTTNIGSKSVYGNDTDGATAAALYPTTGTANDGKIVAVGGLWNGSAHEAFVVRYNSNGTVDSTFGTNGQVNTEFIPNAHGNGFDGVGFQNGLIVAAGDCSTSNYIASGVVTLARFTNTGALDTTFGNAGTGKVTTAIDNGVISVNGLTVQPDGKILIYGEAAPLPVSQGGLGGGYEYFVVRYNTNGTLDTTFGPKGTGIVVGEVSGWDGASAVTVYPPSDSLGNAGKLLVTVYAGNDTALVRYNSDGTLDTSFGTGGVEDSGLPIAARAAALQANDAIVVAGQDGMTAQFGVARFAANGNLDASFGTGGVVYTAIGKGSGANAVAIQPWDGSIVVAGFSVQSSNSRGTTSQVFALARYLGAGPQIGSFTASPNPVPAGSSTTLTASNIIDGNPTSSITQVAFYLDSNGDGVLDAGDTLLGDGSADGLGNWLLNVSTAGWSATDIVFAQAKDNYGVLGDSDTLTLTVQ